MQTAAESATIAATSYAPGVAAADGAAKLGEEILLRAVPDTKVESNVPMGCLIADGAAALTRIGRAMEICGRYRDRTDRTKLRHDF